MANTRNNYAAARALVHATIHGDAAAATTYSITTRTIQNYRSALGNDDELSQYFREMLERATDGWVSSTRTTLQAAARRLQEFVDIANLRDPDAVRELRLTYQMLGETMVMREALIDEHGVNDASRQVSTGDATQAQSAPVLPN